MHRIYQPSNPSGRLVIHLEGRLDSPEVEKDLLTEIQKAKSHSPGTEPVILDLLNTESISDECLRALVRVQTTYRVQFQNYSLYIESQLADNDLLRQDRKENA